MNTTRNGDRIPVAHCAKPDHVGVWLSFEVCHYTNQWNAQCPDCCDGEYDHETGRLHALHEIGSGDTPMEALASYAELCDVDPNELTVTELHV